MDNNQTTSQDASMQSMQCKVCSKVTLADGSQVWVCKECGTEHQPGEAKPVDAAAAQQAVDQAAGAPMTPPAAPVDQPAAPAAPVDPTLKPTL